MSRKPMSKQLDRVVSGLLKASHDKTMSPAKRLEYRGEAKRGRALANWHKKLEGQNPDRSPQKPPRPANRP